MGDTIIHLVYLIKAVVSTIKGVIRDGISVNIGVTLKKLFKWRRCRSYRCRRYDAIKEDSCCSCGVGNIRVFSSLALKKILFLKDFSYCVASSSGSRENSTLLIFLVLNNS